MTVHAYTSFTFSYLNRARALAMSLRRQHPDWVLWAVITDKEPEGFTLDKEAEAFDHWVTAEDLFGEETEAWLFGHDIVEACTAVKGRALQTILRDSTCTKAIYFDPDIGVVNSMQPVVDLLDVDSIVLTPHQLDHEPSSHHRAIKDNEIASLQYGVFNLGFVAVRNDDEGRRFANWWADRLYSWCHDRLDLGLFVDQKWCNLVPCFFDRVKVLRDPGYNVASWNLSQRAMAFDAEGQATINGHLLRFYHFTKLGSVGEVMMQRYAGQNIEVYELWVWYRRMVAGATDPRIPKGWWYYGTFEDGTPISKQIRELYRSRVDIRKAFPNPRAVDGGLLDWLHKHNLFAGPATEPEATMA
jgi:hypothetical protein